MSVHVVANCTAGQQQEFERVLAEEQARHEVEIERLKDDVLKLDLSSEVSFDYNSAALKPAFISTLEKLSSVINKYDRTVVHTIGHTDSSGSEDYNQALSERRASSVSSFLSQRGVPFDRLRTEGMGELAPRATNETEAGRQLNRRVEIYLKPVVEGQEQRAFEQPQFNG
ncbi:MAG: OmpA family protein [Pseudomonadota bacterium]